jgi:hypothetical protein
MGMSFFLLCFLLAAGYYPGGSWADPGQVGFSWRHNYLCDLLDTRAVNGQLNRGRYWARIALGLLCAGLLYLWYYLPRIIGGPSWNRRVLRITGMAALGTTFFLSAGTHDLTLRFAGLFATVTLASAIFGLWKDGEYGLSLLGAWCLAVFLLNYAMYETGSYLGALPVIQKITFSCFFLWLGWLTLLLIRKDRIIRNGELQ